MEETKEMLKAFAQSCLDFVINNKKEEKVEEVDNEAVDKRNYCLSLYSFINFFIS